MSDSGANISDTKGKKRPRGPAKGIKQNPSIQRTLQWDYLHRPIGKWLNDFKTHCGVLARGKISIAIRDWSQVPNGLKETLWLDVQLKFNISEDKEKKKFVLHAINKCWKDFKFNLRRDFIRKTPPPGKKMPYEIGIVSYENFESFKAYVTSTNYEAISKKAKMSKERNLHPHYMGSTSYAQNEVRWRSEGAYPASESTESATSSASINQEQWQSRVEKGEFVPSRYDDVLNRALERKEHPGRALGLGTNTGIKNAFDTARHSSSSQTNMVEIGSAAFNEAVQKAVQIALTQMGITSSCQTPHVSFKSQAGPKPVDKNKSQSGDVDSLIGLSGVYKCNLALMVDERSIIVAHGTVNVDQTVLHGRPILPDHVAVSVDSCIPEYESMNVPVPTEDIVTISDAVSSFVRWPRTMVILKKKRTFTPKIYSQTESVIPSENPNPENPNPENPTPEFRWMLSKKCTNLESILITYTDSDMIFIPDRNRDIIHRDNALEAVYISPQAIREMLSFQYLDTVVLEVFMLAMKKKHPQSFDKIGMLNPTLISAANWSKLNKDNSSLVLKQLLEGHMSKKFILCLYNEKSHWILLVVCVEEREIYFFDPFGNRNRKILFKQHLNRALNALLHTQSECITRKDFAYIPATCVRQTGSVECGYYIMRYMYDIIMHYSQSENLTKDYTRSTIYTISELHEVLDIFATHVMAVLMSIES